MNSIHEWEKRVWIHFSTRGGPASSPPLPKPLSPIAARVMDASPTLQ